MSVAEILVFLIAVLLLAMVASWLLVRAHRRRVS